MRTVESAVVADEVEARQTLRSIVTTPWVSSWLGRARAGDLYATGMADRAAAWSQWALSNLGMFTGVSDRAYPAVLLPGKFYDPRGTAPTLRPHVELSRTLLSREDPFTPERLALAGTGLLFGWWLKDEVTAVRRALFSTPGGSVEDLSGLLASRRGGLADAVSQASERVMSDWSRVEAELVADPAALVHTACADFATADIAAVVPQAEEMGLHAVFDTRLRERNGAWATRRVGVWQLRGVDSSGEPLALGVVSPRLTRNSLFTDPLFDPVHESPGSLLIRALVLHRLLVHLGVSDEAVPVAADPTAEVAKAGPRLRVVVALPGQAMPRPSMEGAVHFLTTYPQADAAWAALSRWADAGEYLLTVTPDGFAAAHAAASRCVRRAEEPDRADIEVLLPLAWDARNRVVRVTFSKPVAEGE